MVPIILKNNYLINTINERIKYVMSKIIGDIQCVFINKTID